MGVYATVIPRRFILEDGTEATLTARDVEERLTRETLFLLWVPCIDTVYSHLVGQGFEKAVPAKSKGEKYSLRKPLDNTWELHLRLYREGYIEAEVEVRKRIPRTPHSREKTQRSLRGIRVLPGSLQQAPHKIHPRRQMDNKDPRPPQRETKTTKHTNTMETNSPRHNSGRTLHLRATPPRKREDNMTTNGPDKLRRLLKEALEHHRQRETQYKHQKNSTK